MPDSNRRLQKCGCALLGAPALCFLLGVSAGAATGGAGATNNSPSAGSTAGAFSAKLAQAAQGVPADVNCPAAEVRRGAATLTVGPTGERTAMTLKYQASFIRLARECALVEGNMVMKVGVEGRIVLGPAGSPGPVNVPLRFAVVQETASGGMRATPTTALDDYILYVGFDPVSAEAQSKPAPKTRPKSKHKTSAPPASPPPAPGQ
jgi:hypothetical protein